MVFDEKKGYHIYVHKWDAHRELRLVRLPISVGMLLVSLLLARFLHIPLRTQ